jgi:hypothetical protein
MAARDGWLCAKWCVEPAGAGKSPGMSSTGSHAARGNGTTARDDRKRMTPAQLYCLLGGIALLLAGLLGFISDATFDTAGGDRLQGDSFLGFEVNGWHNLVHVLSGLLLLSAFRRRGPAKTVALAFGLVYGVVTIIGLIDGNDVLGIIPVNPADNILHIALSALGIVTGLMSSGREDMADAKRSDPGRRIQRDPGVSTEPERGATSR